MVRRDRAFGAFASTRGGPAREHDVAPGGCRTQPPGLFAPARLFKDDVIHLIGFERHVGGETGNRVAYFETGIGQHDVPPVEAAAGAQALRWPRAGSLRWTNADRWPRRRRVKLREMRK